MTITIFDLFSIGIGPSSSHTVGPMRAARRFVVDLDETGLLDKSSSVKVDLYGSLALTGKGHATDKAILLGLEGETPESVDPEKIEEFVSGIHHHKKINLNKKRSIAFDPGKDLIFHYDKFLPYHPNGMRFTAFNEKGKELVSEVWYSVGGGFIVDHKAASRDVHLGDDPHKIPYPFASGDELLKLCRTNALSIANLMLANERCWRSEEDVSRGLLHIWDVMQKCIDRGCRTPGILPGGLNVPRRAPALFKTLTSSSYKKHPAEVMDWVSAWALAVNEENAAGGRVVTAPTNGSAGIIPAVLKYYTTFCEGANDAGVVTFMLAAGAIGILYKLGASISAAEMGCMGEVGVACSMAAAGLTAALGGTNEQIENAAEIGMEHNLGLTCDPLKGLVQIPCIERNALGSVKAISATLLALHGDGTHRVSLDQVIATMRQTGRDMKSIYKETSQGGLAVNVPEC